MRFGLNVVSTILQSFGSRKVQSGSRNTYLPNIFARRNPRAAARSARLRATKSAGRIRNGNTGSTTWRSTEAVDGASAPSRDGAAPKKRGPRPLRRCNDVFIVPPPKDPELPGAYKPDASFMEPGFPSLDDPHFSQLVQEKLFLDAFHAGRQTLLRAANERREKAEARQRAEDAEYARLLKRDSESARTAQRRAEDAEFARLLEEDRRKAQEAQRRAEAEEAARRERERVEEERRRQRAEAEEAKERARREREQRERERLNRMAIAEAEQLRLIERLRVYEQTWAALRNNTAGTELLDFYDIPWPVFGDVRCGDDVTEERILEFVRHPLQEHVRGPGESQAKSIRSEMLRWHPDKFERKVLARVVEADREVVKETAGHIVRILTKNLAQG
jgi:hypothetical protein